jgi:hypothetical protein
VAGATPEAGTGRGAGPGGCVDPGSLGCRRASGVIEACGLQQ